MKDYGKEVIIDLHNCNPDIFSRENIRQYLKDLCHLIDMERAKLCWWDDRFTPENEKETEPHLIGTTAVQFIKTSNITIHTLDILKKVYVNVFSCKDFDPLIVSRYTARFFQGEAVNVQIMRRM